jgi:hypothetical protein
MPSGTGVNEQRPLSELHGPETTWHSSGATHTKGVPAQTPEMQTSPVVQRFPSEHPVPSVRAALSHWPLALHVA